MNRAATIVLCNCWMLGGRAAALHRRLARHIRWYADGYVGARPRSSEDDLRTGRAHRADGSLPDGPLDRKGPTRWRSLCSAATGPSRRARGPVLRAVCTTSRRIDIVRIPIDIDPP